ncbi:Transposon [Phanerochaete sordida]|uniref:Transposon n=1 Tax=Phanerochaete sordida TaxID=48140 RepID=A0A9P3GJS5_9APHY|nr:Transposon [Phanerochaete sordida]
MQLHGPELNYPTHEKELLAIVRALKKWRTDLLGVYFQVFTDHKPLTEFMRQKNLSRRQARWQEYMGQYEFDIEYVPGEDNSPADSLSRLPPDDALGGSSVVVAAVGSLRISTDPAWLDKIRSGYRKDPWCKSLLQDPNAVGIRIEDGLLFLGERLVIPRVRDVREALFRLAHDCLGHFGADKSYAALRASYYWPRMRKEMEDMYVPSCEECQRNKSLTRKPAGPLHSLPVPDRRGSSIAIDFVGPLPEDEGMNCIATITDRLGADFRPIATRTDITAEDFAVLFFDHWYCENGLPDDIISDRDKLWLSRFWKALHRLTGVDIKLSSSYHPQTDGASERSNKTVIQALRYHVARNQRGWARALPRVRFHIMNTVNASTGFTPFQLHLGRCPKVLPPLLDSAIAETRAEFGDPAFDAARVIRQVDTDTMEAQDNMHLAKIHQTTQANKHRGPEVPYSVGERVLLSTVHRRREYMQRGSNRVAKFMVRYDGPFTVTAAHPETSSYTLALPSHMKICPTFHSSLLKPFKTNDAALFPSRERTRPKPVLAEDGVEEWPVEAVLDVKHLRRGDKYLVRWQGFGPSGKTVEVL